MFFGIRYSLTLLYQSCYKIVRRLCHSFAPSLFLFKTNSLEKSSFIKHAQERFKEYFFKLHKLIMPLAEIHLA